MGFLDKAKAAAEQAANKANETVAEVQAKRDLTKAYADLGAKAYALASAGAITHPDLSADVERIRGLRAKIEADGGDAGPGPSDAAGAGTAAAAADAAGPAAGGPA
jgi:hypothetical protein